MKSFKELKESTGQSAGYCISLNAEEIPGAEACLRASMRVEKIVT